MLKKFEATTCGWPLIRSSPQVGLEPTTVPLTAEYRLVVASQSREDDINFRLPVPYICPDF